MTNKFKVGDKVKMPTRKTPFSSLSEFQREMRDYKEDFMIVGSIESNGICDYCLERADKKAFISNVFNEEDLDPYEEEFVLPEKWVIRITPENASFFRNTKKNGLYHEGPYHHNMGGYYTAIPIGNTYGFCSIPKGYTEITFEQFQKHVLNKINMSRAQMELDGKPLSNKKIIGYKAPQDFFGGAVKKGEIYSKQREDHRWYSPKSTQSPNYLNGQSMPQEIVETWEPVYEEEKIVIAGYEAKLERHVDGDAVAFGCQKIRQYQLEFLKNLLSVKEAEFKLTAKGEEITVKTIESLINMLK